MIKKYHFIYYSLLSLLIAGSAKAQFGLQKTAPQAGYSTEQSDINTVANTIVNGVLSVLAVAFFGIMMYAGIRWMMARGNEELAGKAKTALQTSIIGFILTII